MATGPNEENHEPGAVTQLLQAVSQGSDDASARLFDLIHDELRALAGSVFRHERQGHTLQPTALVHEAWVRLVGSDQPDYENKLHFLAIAGTTMRRVLVDHARARGTAKRGGDVARVTLSEAEAAPGASANEVIELLDLHDALDELAELEPRHARVVELRYFGGLTTVEAAQVLGLSERSVRGDWAMAKSWLQRRLGSSAR